ncbi:prepilin-type N-terminal cleavage/methylation domain-containing protein [Patescibacteria group bacterium]|nr:prepilin-type N-terminal cleavage/methylation domain-containing protein [Patescibacteria group bacterium]
MKKQKAFTLIEVLVVIAIIGFLASITLVSIKEARERARIAKGLNFAAQVHHALGAYAVGIWDFDDNTFPTQDISGYENHGDCTNCPIWTAEKDTPSRKGYALIFDGQNDYLDCGDANLLGGGNQFTIMYWARPGRDLKEESSVWYGGVTEYTEYSLGWQGWTDGITVDFLDTSGTRHFMDTWDTYLLEDQWYHIVGLYDGTYLKVHINGEFIRQENEGSHTVRTTTNAFRIGYAGGVYWDGTIDEVRVYEEALTSAQIKKLYVEGARKRGLLTQE